MEDPVEETFDKLVFWLGAGKAEPGSPTYEEARNKITIKLAVAMVNAIEGFRSAMEASARQTEGLNRVLVRLTWTLVILGAVAIVIAAIRP